LTAAPIGAAECAAHDALLPTSAVPVPRHALTDSGKDPDDWMVDFRTLFRR